MRTRRRRNKIDDPIAPILRLWLLRLLVPMGVQSKFASFMGIGNDALAEALGLQDWIGINRADFDAKTLRAKLRELYESAEVQLQDTPLQELMPEPLSANIARIAKLVNLSDTDCRILEFAVMVRCEPLLEYACTELGALSSNRFFQPLSLLLNAAEPEIRASLNAQGILVKSGLVSLDRTSTSALNEGLTLLSETFADHIYSSSSDPISLLQGIVALSAPAELDMADYSHIAQALDMLRPYLKQAVATRQKGVNIFVYGDPGTGKSQLAKVLAQALQCELFEVASEDGAGDAVDGACRLRVFRVAQSFFSQRKVLFVFDEVEDVFNDSDNLAGGKSAAQTSKAWLNRTLEQNPVPTLWLSNSLQGK